MSTTKTIDDEMLFLLNARMVRVQVGNRYISVPVTAKYEKTNSITKKQEYRLLTWDGWMQVNEQAYSDAEMADVIDGEPLFEQAFRLQREKEARSA